MGVLLSPDCGMIWDDEIRLRSFPRRKPAHHVDEDRDEDEDDADEEAHRLSLLSPRYYRASGAGPSRCGCGSWDQPGRLAVGVLRMVFWEVEGGRRPPELDGHLVVHGGRLLRGVGVSAVLLVVDDDLGPP